MGARCCTNEETAKLKQEGAKLDADGDSPVKFSFDENDEKLNSFSTMKEVPPDELLEPLVTESTPQTDMVDAAVQPLIEETTADACCVEDTPVAGSSSAEGPQVDVKDCNYDDWTRLSAYESPTVAEAPAGMGVPAADAAPVEGEDGYDYRCSTLTVCGSDQVGTYAVGDSDDPSDAVITDSNSKEAHADSAEDSPEGCGDSHEGSPHKGAQRKGARSCCLCGSKQKVLEDAGDS